MAKIKLTSMERYRRRLRRFKKTMGGADPGSVLDVVGELPHDNPLEIAYWRVLDALEPAGLNIDDFMEHVTGRRPDPEAFDRAWKNLNEELRKLSGAAG